MFDEPTPPLANRLLVDLKTLGDILIQGSLGTGENDPSPRSHRLHRVSAGRQEISGPSAPPRSN
jgi:hypothetical protein